MLRDHRCRPLSSEVLIFQSLEQSFETGLTANCVFCLLVCLFVCLLFGSDEPTHRGCRTDTILPRQFLLIVHQS